MENKQAKIRHTEEFKKQVIEVYKSGVYATAKECAESYGINSKTFHHWLIKASNPVTNEETELKKLQKEFAKLKMENDILKKAAAYFALHVK